MTSHVPNAQHHQVAHQAQHQTHNNNQNLTSNAASNSLDVREFSSPPASHFHTFSHSMLCAFEDCKLRFKFQYVDRVPRVFEANAEMFLGDVVHRTLAMVFSTVKEGKEPTIEESLTFFNNIWVNEWSDKILMVKNKTNSEYRKLGEVFLKGFFEEFAPFRDVVVGVETKEFLRLSDGSRYHVRIDLLQKSGDTFFVADFKTGAIKEERELVLDRQLAMYAIWVKKAFSSARVVELVWYFLAHKRVVRIRKSDLDLRELEDLVVKRISELKKCIAFPATISERCPYCLYNNICPEFNNKGKPNIAKSVEKKAPKKTKLAQKTLFEC